MLAIMVLHSYFSVNICKLCIVMIVYFMKIVEWLFAAFSTVFNPKRSTFTESNHLYFHHIPIVRRNSHLDSFYRELPLCGTDTRVDASLNILNLTSESLELVVIYPSYPHDFHFRHATLTFISHTTLNNLRL